PSRIAGPLQNQGKRRDSAALASLRASRRALAGAPQHEGILLMELRKYPHPEEAAKRPSRRTHSANQSTPGFCKSRTVGAGEPAALAAGGFDLNGFRYRGSSLKQLPLRLGALAGGGAEGRGGVDARGARPDPLE